MLRFAANVSWLFSELTFFNRFKAASEHGFKSIEFLFPYSYDKDKIARALSSCDLELILFDFPSGNWEKGDRGLACDPRNVSAFKSSVHKAVSWANFLGVKKLNCLIGKSIDYISYEEQFKTCVDNLKFAAEVLDKHGITLLIEPINQDDIPGYFLNTIDEVVKIITTVGADNVYLQFDIYHVQRTHGEILGLLNKYIQRIAHIQVADNHGRHEPGTGEINFKNVLKKIDQSNYQGYISLEYNPLKDTQNSLKWMKDYGYKL